MLAPFNAHGSLVTINLLWYLLKRIALAYPSLSLSIYRNLLHFPLLPFGFRWVTLPYTSGIGRIGYRRVETLF
jgi:hypothetical protein